MEEVASFGAANLRPAEVLGQKGLQRKGGGTLLRDATCSLLILSPDVRSEPLSKASG